MSTSKISVINGRLIGTTGAYAGALSTISFNSPLDDCGIDLKCDIDGVATFVLIRVGSRDFATTVAAAPQDNTLILSHINGLPSGDTVQELFNNLSAAMSVA